MGMSQLANKLIGRGPLTSTWTTTFQLTALPDLSYSSCRFTRQGCQRSFSLSSTRHTQTGKRFGNSEISQSTKTYPKRKTARSQAAKASLRRTVHEAQQGRDGQQRHHVKEWSSDSLRKTVTAYCAAEVYDIPKISQKLQDVGYSLDPFKTHMAPHVVHFRFPSLGSTGSVDDANREHGDIFIFPSGTVVAWDVEEEAVKRLIGNIFVDAAETPHSSKMEMEDLDYQHDEASDTSQMIGDTVILGTKMNERTLDQEYDSTELGRNSEQQHQANLILAKMAFSSGLARSTKVAVLESALDNYFESTRTIPTTLSKGSRLPFTRSFILRKTGELLNMRAQLNLSSELTDSLPDLFWDSPYELGLENYFVQVSRALDVGVRIRALNEKMNYAQDIASVLQTRLSEKHSNLLEVLIIGLITFEVLFEIGRLGMDYKERQTQQDTEVLLKEWLQRELAKQDR